jgi:anti-sigma factor RsiW
MGETGDRMDRAGRYVLGLMDDEERERAERDLEIDPAFRDAMVEIAERMHVFDRLPAPDQLTDTAPQDGWRLIKERIAAMPQMRPAPEPTPPEPAPVELTQTGAPVTFGRRRSDRLRGTIMPEMPSKTIGTGLHSAPGRQALVLALCLIAAFALGYVAGVTSVGSTPSVATAP